MNEPNLTIELFRHMDAGDRAQWRDDQNLRPLNDLGRRQAERLAEALGEQPLDGLYSSPALRCVQSLEPLGRRFRLAIETHEGLSEANGYPSPVGLEQHRPQAAYGGAFVAGRALSALDTVVSAHPRGRVAVCTHGDTMPALLALLAGRYRLGSQHEPVGLYGYWHTLSFRAGSLTVEFHEAPARFPVAGP
jgi:8-oxo-dGTP diphosphatase